MTWHFLHWAARAPVNDAYEKAVLMVLAEAADGSTGVTLIGQKTVSERCAMSERQVIRIMKRLEDGGLLKRSKRYGADGHRTSDSTQLLPDHQADRLPDHEGNHCLTTGQGISKINSQIKNNVSEPEKPIKAKATYPVEFEGIWIAFPHFKGRSSKSASLAAWQNLTIADRQDLVSAVCYFSTSPQAKKDGGQFVPAMERWIKKDQWRDFAGPSAPAQPVTPPDLEKAAWEARVKHWRQCGKWSRADYGPRPDEPDCQAPADVLARHGLPPRLRVVGGGAA